MGNTEMLETIINACSDGSQAKFARELGESPQTINAWLRRGKIDVVRIYKVYRCLNPHWLLTGEGEMMKPDLSNDQPSVVSTIHARQSEVSVTQTNGACQSELVVHLKSLLEEKERTIQVQQQLIDALRKP